MNEKINLETFPQKLTQALALIYTNSKAKSVKEAKELFDIYYKAFEEIEAERKRLHDEKSSGKSQKVII